MSMIYNSENFILNKFKRLQFNNLKSNKYDFCKWYLICIFIVLNFNFAMCIYGTVFPVLK